MRALKPAFVAPEVSQYLRPLAYYVGRLQAFHAVLGLACPGQPKFGELNLGPQDEGERWEAALYAVYRRLGSALSRMSLEERENLRAATLDLSRGRTRHSPLVNSHDPDYCLALSMAYRQIVAALDMRRASKEWLV